MSTEYPTLHEEFSESYDPLTDFDDEYSLDGVDEETLRELLKLQLENPNQNLSTKTMPTGVKLSVIGDHVFQEDDTDDISHWDSAESLLEDVRMHDSFHRFYGDKEGEFNTEFWQHPVTVYHGTNDMHGILSEGINATSDTRGISNRGVGASVFTSTNVDIAEEYAHDGEASGLDGGVVAIDTNAMKRDGYTPNVSQEPEVLEEELASALMNAVGVEYNVEYSDSGMDPDTIIIDGSVPAKYLQMLVLT